MNYARTAEGQNAAYGAESALPRKLKSILKVIDGKTLTSVFETSLSSFGDVKKILRSLEMAGLIHLQSDNAHRPGHRQDRDESNRATSKQGNDSSAWADTRNPVETVAHSSRFEAESRPHSPSPLSANAAASYQASEQHKADALASMVNDMSNFVLTFVPEQSLQILKEIEEISSLEILAATLGGYEQMIQHLGKNSADHLRHIRTTLRDVL